MEGIAKLLPAGVRQQLLRSDASMLEALSALWASMVGRGIAQQCRPVDFRAGTLTIATSCPTWAIQFRQLNDEIRHNISQLLGVECVRKIRVRLDPAFNPPALPEAARDFGRPLREATPGPTAGGGDALGILRQSCNKYFARKTQKTH